MSIQKLELDARLHAQARPDPELAPELARSLVARAAVRARQTRRRRIALSVTAILAGGVLAVPATAVGITTFTAQTGIFNRAADGGTPPEAVETIDSGSEGSPGSEWIDMAAPDLEQYIVSVAPRELPLPSGTTWDEVLTGFFDRFSQHEYLESNSLGGGGGVRAESVVIDAMLEREARRAWLVDWFQAYRVGDVTRMARAGAALEASVDWPAEQLTSRGAYAEETKGWMRMIGAGDFEAAQAYASFSEWAELSDGGDRSELSDAILGGRVTAPEAGGAE